MTSCRIAHATKTEINVISELKDEDINKERSAKWLGPCIVKNCALIQSLGNKIAKTNRGIIKNDKNHIGAK